MRLIPPAEYRHMPWKNGGGSTTEIAVSPVGAGLDSFDWRVSMASVAEPGPFSLFPAVDRTLSVLSGNGIALDIADRKIVLGRSSPPEAFAADIPVYGAPLNGPITDLNVMTRRGRYRHGVRRLVGVTNLRTGLEGETTLILAVNDLDARANGETVRVPAGGTLRIDRPIAALELGGDRLDAYLIALYPA